MRYILLIFSITILFFVFLNCDTASSNSDNNTNGSSPSLYLSGDDTVYINPGTEYTEPGYAAVDVEDEILTDSVKIGYFKSDKITTTIISELKNIEGTYFVKYTVIDSDENTTIAWRCLIVEEEKVIGNKPVISLVGDDTVYINDFASYTELGYSCTDNEDGDLTDSVKIKWYEKDKITELDTSKNYSDSITFIKYYATDSDGGYAACWRCVKVLKDVAVTLGSLVPSHLDISSAASGTATIEVEASNDISAANNFTISVVNSEGQVTSDLSVNISYTTGKTGDATITVIPEDGCLKDTFTVTITATLGTSSSSKSFTVFVVDGVDPNENTVSIFSNVKIMVASAAGSNANNCATLDGSTFTYTAGKSSATLQDKCDFVYYYVTGAIISSPNAVPSMINSGYSDWSIINKTVFKVATSSDWDETTSSTDANIISAVSGATVTQATDVEIGDVYAFVTASGKKGLFKVVALNPGYVSDCYITIDIKVQD